jgi:major membrane immunogen (membrane-anchored lipoprotein)
VRNSLIAAALAAVLAGGLTACGERPQDITYKQGTYQGKQDTRPWDNEPFKGDQKAWELALKDRAQAQNEYKRAN